ncbi:MAG: hypothetical protein A2328_09200 [Bdellovibrionales bacterium RIFOXYB2_FULL_36_6]|nr:MAG: hypothetical protein A2328_09200 [Bdellovibrionales bacterium RIFOXYB2_FULL_36_6]
MKSALIAKSFVTILIYLLICFCFSHPFSLVLADDLTQDQVLFSSYPRGGAEFGYSVDIDGSYAVAGAYKDDVQIGGEMHYEAGKAWILEKANGLWSADPELVRSEAPESSDLFGKSVAINGSFAVVGAPMVDLPNKNNAGAVYVFKNNLGSWDQTAKLTASDAATNDMFGSSVDIHGDYIIVGAPQNDAAYIFKLENDVWVQKQRLTVSGADTFGNAVSITDGFAVVGDQTDDDQNGPASGAVYFFEKNGETWSLDDQIFPSDAQQYDLFGASVSIDGEYAIVGAPLVDYTVTGPIKLEGSSYIFRRTGGSWIQHNLIPLQADDTTPGGNHFGTSVSIKGHTIVIGAPGDNDRGEGSGAAFLFKRIGGEWVNQTRLIATDGITNNYMGMSVAVDGDSILAGSPGYSNGSRVGAVYTYSFISSDFDGDGDVDGLDVYTLITNLTSGAFQSDYIPTFAQSFGYGPGMVMQMASFPQTNSSMSLSASMTSDNLALSKVQSSSEDNTDFFKIEEITWIASNGQYGLATGEWMWQINKLSLDPGENHLKLIVQDAAGNIAEKDIMVVYNEILSANGTGSLEKWVRRLTYNFKFENIDLEKTLTAADLTVWLWPNKIIIIDDYLNLEDIDSNSITTENGYQYYRDMNCDNSNKDTLYLDLPF